MLSVIMEAAYVNNLYVHSVGNAEKKSLNKMLEEVIQIIHLLIRSPVLSYATITWREYYESKYPLWYQSFLTLMFYYSVSWQIFDFT